MMRRLPAMIVTVLLAAGMVPAQTQEKPAAKPAASAGANETALLPSEATVESFMKHMFSYDPNLDFKVVRIAPAEAPGVSQVLVSVKGPQGPQEMVLYVLPGEKWAVAGELIPFGADPFAAARAELEAKAHGPTRGPATSTIHVVEFSDLQCPACKAAQPTIDKLLQDVPSARFTFENFPLEQVHPWAFKAAEYADCVARTKPDAFWKFVEADYAAQEQVTLQNVDEKMKAFATEAGADANAVAACVAQPATAARVRESLALGKAVHVTGTPTLFVDGRKIGNVTGIPYEVLKALVENTPNH